MKCPFRVIKEYEYADDLGTDTHRVVVLNREIEEFAECYKEECPNWKWDISKGGYYCAQANILDDSKGGTCVDRNDDDIQQ